MKIIGAGEEENAKRKEYTMRCVHAEEAAYLPGGCVQGGQKVGPNLLIIDHTPKLI